MSDWTVHILGHSLRPFTSGPEAKTYARLVNSKFGMVKGDRLDPRIWAVVIPPKESAQ